VLIGGVLEGAEGDGAEGDGAGSDAAEGGQPGETALLLLCRDGKWSVAGEYD
jgi:hypothetical protein